MRTAEDWFIYLSSFSSWYCIMQSLVSYDWLILFDLGGTQGFNDRDASCCALPPVRFTSFTVRRQVVWGRPWLVFPAGVRTTFRSPSRNFRKNISFSVTTLVPLLVVLLRPWMRQISIAESIDLFHFVCRQSPPLRSVQQRSVIHPQGTTVCFGQNRTGRNLCSSVMFLSYQKKKKWHYK